MTNFDLHILLIGPRLNRTHTNLGGATRSFEETISYFQNHGINYHVLNTQQRSGVIRVFRLTLGYMLLIWKSDVVFLNLSQNGIRKLAPILARLTIWLGKKVVIRPFGSSLKTIYQELSEKKKKSFRKYILNADILYVQTQELLNFFQPLGRSVKQLKTSRPKPGKEVAGSAKGFAKRFVFLGQIRNDKGIDELIGCINQLDKDYTIHLYGPIEDPTYTFLNNKPYYKGLLYGQEEVLSTLTKYDVLVLPTFYSGEGYPGVIVEAYSVGLPVITSNWKSLPEIVIHGETGLLVPPRSSEDLLKAIKSITVDNHTTMSKRVLNYYSSNFETETVMGRVLDDFRGLF